MMITMKMMMGQKITMMMMMVVVGVMVGMIMVGMIMVVVEVIWVVGDGMRKGAIG